MPPLSCSTCASHAFQAQLLLGCDEGTAPTVKPYPPRRSEVVTFQGQSARSEKFAEGQVTKAIRQGKLGRFLSPGNHTSGPPNGPTFGAASYRMISRAVSFTANVGEQGDEVFMSAQQMIDKLVRILRAWALRYKVLAGGLDDRQTVAEVSAYADELQAEAERLADSRWPLAAQRLRIFCR